MSAPAPGIARHPEARLIHRGLGRAEFFDLAPEQFAALDKIAAALRGEGRTRFSFHAPVVRPDFFPFDGIQCFFLCEDDARREDSFRLLAHTLDAARAFGAEYAVCHLTYGRTDTRDPKTAARLAAAAGARFAALSRATGVPLDVEFAGYTDSFHDPASFLDAVGPHAELGVCVDIGHTFLSAKQRGRDYLADIATLAPRARSMHLWNTTGPECHARHHHVPLHPSQRPADGWIDVPAAVGAVLDRNPAVRLVFEYPVEAVTPEIQAGYDWIADLVAATADQKRKTTRIPPP